MSAAAIERRTYTPLGWPRAGALDIGTDGVPRVPINCGSGETFWIADPAYARQFGAALVAAANCLESLARPEPPGPEREPQVESTAVIDAVPAEPPPPEPADVLVHPATAQEAADA